MAICALSQLANGFLHLEYRCPGGFYGNLSSHRPVNDGQWHSMLLEERDTSVHLLVDITDNTSLVIPEECQGLRTERHLLLGGLVPSNPSSNVSLGFEGCLDAVVVNSERLELLGHRKKMAGYLETWALSQCCWPGTTCSQNPCLNGGSCSPALGSGMDWEDDPNQGLIPKAPDSDLSLCLTIELIG
jgi:protocadherin Fat 1/2/3